MGIFLSPLIISIRYIMTLLNKTKILSDLSKIAADAMGTFSGIKKEIETIVGLRVDRLIKKMNLVKGDIIDNKYYRFKFIEGDNQINIFFDKNSYNIVGWQNIDIYQNLVITYLFNVKKNIKIKKNQFKLPEKNQ